MSKSESMAAGFSSLALAVLLVLSSSALAHGSTKPEHGGVVQLSGETLFELVVQGSGVALYVKDDGEAVSSADMTARLVMIAKGEKSEVALKSAGGNKFEATAATIPVGARVAIILTNKSTLAQTSATFSIK